ncbi:UNVERIFIED_CONTAM: hypothetical protein Scaly_0107900 [Sesamum calycinum]|uniref:Aminotransferase-like plant mobile domain-containing protein n=1 Tax=Sesamum calycinum TaxID=2727403 RepID=A0AAW2SVW7_9LAMI
MVYFKDKSSPSGENHLIILGNQNQPLEKGTMLAVYAPLIGGRNVSPWPRLTNSSPLSEWCQETSLSKNVKAWILRANHHEPPRHQPSDDFAHLCTLGRSIIEGDASGMVIFVLPENFAIPKDIGSGLRTCLADVEIDCAISKYMMLFMLHCLLMTTIPISSNRFAKHGALLQILCILLPGKCPFSLWDLHELVGLPMTGCLYDEVVPSALELTGVDEKRERFIPVPVSICFTLITCFKVPMISMLSQKKTVRPKSTHNPLGDIATHERWSTAEDALFAKLCIERSLKEEVYLAAYLACWLCLFVLPGNDVNSIRPSTFKMASLMANGRRVNLAIPVLASIYEGLNTIATSPNQPMTRFSGEGGAKYYEPREARKRIHKAEFVSWACNMLVKAEPFKFVDDGRAEELDHSYFVAIRSSYLTLRRGGRFIVEPYSPHRFGRQFGYYQDPKLIKITLKRKKDEDKQVDGGENDPPCALVPPIVIECDSQAAVVELEDEVQSIDVGEESETSHSSTMTPPLGMGLKRKQSSPPAAVSVLKGESFLFNYQKEFLQRLWSGLIVKISNTPVDFLSSIEDDVYLILESMKSFQKFDVSKVEESLNMFFAKVRAYDEARSLSSEKFVPKSS